MNYITQLNGFYNLLQGKCLSSSAQLLYHTLLMINNSCGWIEYFPRTNLNICHLTGMSENTLKKARNELKQTGLIDFVQGSKKKGATQYKLIHIVSKYRVNVDTIADTITDPITDTKPADIYKYKQKQNETKLNNYYNNSPKTNRSKFNNFTVSTDSKIDYAEVERRAMEKIMSKHDASPNSTRGCTP